MNYCEECGSKLLPGNTFCENCGSSSVKSSEKNTAKEPFKEEMKTANVQPSEQEVYRQSQPQVPVYASQKKKSKSPFFVIGGLLLLVFFILAAAVVAGYFFIYKDSDKTIEKVLNDDDKNGDKTPGVESKKKVNKTDEEKKVTEKKKEGFQKREKRDGDCGDYPELSERRLNADELSGVTDKEKRYMWNDIYMRHGYIFTDEDLLLHFAMFSCYNPKYLNVNKYLTEIEGYNIKLLKN